MSTLALERETTEQRPGGVWDYVSPSRLNLWLKCPLSFRLKYVDGIQLPTTPALFLGQRVHDGLEIFYRHRQLGVELTPEDVAKRMRGRWGEAVDAESMKFESTEEEDGLKQKAIDLVDAYLKAVSDVAEVPIAVETSLKAPLVDPATGEDLGISLTGIVDVILDGCDGGIV